MAVHNAHLAETVHECFVKKLVHGSNRLVGSLPYNVQLLTSVLIRILQVNFSPLRSTQLRKTAALALHWHDCFHEFQIFELFSEAQRFHPHFSFIAFHAINNSDRTE